MQPTIVQVKIDELKPAEYNPRQMTTKAYADLKKSIEKFGLVDPLLVNINEARKNIVIGGHMRLRIAKELNLATVPVVYLDLNEEQEKELNLRLNKNVGEWDFDLLSSFSNELLFEVGFTEFDLKRNDPMSEEKEVDEAAMKTDKECPKCGYTW